MVKAQICEAGVTSISLTLGQCFPISVAYRTALRSKHLVESLNQIIVYETEQDRQCMYIALWCIFITSVSIELQQYISF
jgi:hypothetical protein